MVHTWLLWSGVSRFTPSQHDGKNTCERKDWHLPAGNPGSSGEFPPKHTISTAFWAKSELFWVLNNNGSQWSEWQSVNHLSIPSIRISSDHPEAIRRGNLREVISITWFDSRSIITSSLQVVCCWSSELYNFKLVVGVVVVELRHPVVAVIQCLIACCWSGIIGWEFV